MATGGVDEVLVPGQVTTLQKRIDGLEPERQRCEGLLQEALDEAAGLTKSGGDPKGLERTLKRAARLRVELAAVTGEIETLQSLVAARLAQTTRPW